MSSPVGRRPKVRWRVQAVRNWLQAHASRRKVIGGIVGVGGIAAVVIIALLSQERPPADEVARPPAATGAAKPVATAGPSDSGDWAALRLPPYEPVATLEADDHDGSGISVAGWLTFRSLTSTPAVELAAGLVADPPVELHVEPGASADVARVRPAAALAESARYRIQLRMQDGALAGEWSFRTGGPLTVVRRLPDDRSTQVPVDTGIEIEFDQDGVEDVEGHFSIAPAVEGTFEIHGRTWVFVPSTPLEPATLYTVTLKAGVGMTDSDRTLESDVRFAFETASTREERSELGVAFDHATHEVQPDEPPVIPASVLGDAGEGTSITRRVVLYTLPTLEAALDATATLAVDRGWASWSDNGTVPTDDLAQAGAFDATVSVSWPTQFVQLPTGLASGWYLLAMEQEGRDAQVVIQVTDLAAFTLTSETRTVAWVNDLAVGAPVAGASLSLRGGPDLGVTDAAGLMEAPTPTELEAGGETIDPRLVLVSAPDGRRLILPLAGERGWFSRAAPSSRWWLLFGTDRQQYRTDDTIRVWGVIAARADRTVPARIEIRLLAGWDVEGPPIARALVSPTARGVVVGEVPVRDLPPGQFLVAMFVDGEPVTQASITVTDIRKPVFRIEVTTDRRAYVHGDKVHARAAANFYDGSGAPGLDLRLSTSGLRGGNDQVVTVGPTGAAEITLRAASSGPGMESGHVGANPARPEEGSSSGSASFAVFPSEAWLAAEATLGAGTLTVAGDLSRVDLAAAEAQFVEAGWVDDPRGEALAARTVSIIVDHVTWRPVQTGTTYDFLQKRNVPRYEYEREVDRIGTYAPTSAADGSFGLSLPFTPGNGGVEVTLSAEDDDGRRIELRLWAESEPTPTAPTALPYLETPSWCGAATLTAAIGETTAVTVRSDGKPDVGGRTLFLVGHLGLDDAILTTGAELERVLEVDDLPSVMVRAIRLTPTGYVVTNDAQIRVSEEDTTIEVTVESDGARYAPGEDVTLAISTLRPDGTPVAADVIVQAVDAKLYAIGAAQAVETTALMTPVSAGFLGSYASHVVPSPEDDCGFGASTGGDEPRDDFADLATFQIVSTGADGRGSAAFGLPDDLTSWVVTATAVGDGLETGTRAIEIPVGLPFFVDATIASEYLAGEKPVIQLRAYGDELAEGDQVRFTIKAPSLGVDETVEGPAFEAIQAALPVLPLGDHELAIVAERIGTGPELSDGVVRHVRVVPTRLRTLRTAYDVVDARFDPPGGDGMTTYIVTDGGRGRLLPVLNDLAWSSSARFDAALAATLAAEILTEDFGLGPTDLPATTFAGAEGHPAEGLAVMPYASADLALTARTAIVAPDRMSSDFLAAALRAELDADPTRERRIIALAGLAGLGEETLSDLRALQDDDLTVRERVWLALGLVAGGDEDGARSIERAVLADHGQRLGPWVRLDFRPSTPESDEVTASMLLLAAELRDPIANDISRYLLDNPSSEYLPALEQVGFARAAMNWMPREEARFAWTVDGQREERTLEHGSSLTLRLTADQRQGFALEKLDGELIVASAWLGEAAYDELPNDPSVTIERVVSPADHAPSGELVRVTVNVSFQGAGVSGCYQVTDLLPSGLSPVAEPWLGWNGDPERIAPYEVEGQRVSWCVGTDRRSVVLGYAARVVSAGTYRWEPAVIQSAVAPAIGSATAVTTYTID